jgi:hypothetical protein
MIITGSLPGFKKSSKGVSFAGNQLAGLLSFNPVSILFCCDSGLLICKQVSIPAALLCESLNLGISCRSSPIHWSVMQGWLVGSCRNGCWVEQECLVHGAALSSQVAEIVEGLAGQTLNEE